ncbi:hypothetical protein [Ancylomarina longa]|nr:hypothetical protein [Ancylomarina longa]
MNRYLIVVFCVLTGCAAAVPVANAEAISVDQLLLAEWFAGHVQNLEENYSSPILVPVEKEQITSDCIYKLKGFSVLKKLPEFPANISNNSICYTPLARCLATVPDYACHSYKQIPDSDCQIRAPGFFC